MAIKYVDYEGEAGTGDGSSFANRAKSIFALYNQADKDGGGNHSGTASSGSEYIGYDDEIRIKKSPDPTSLGTGYIWRNKSTLTSGERERGFHGNINTIVYSGTTGATQLTTNYKHDLETGDWIVLFQNNNSDANINGLWKVTVVDNWNFKLDGYTPNSTRVSAGNGSGGRFAYWSGRMVELTSKVVEEIAFCRDPNATATEVTNAFTPVDSNVEVQHLWGSQDQYWTGNSTASMAIMGPHSSQQVNVKSSFTGTGKAAHYQLPATLDLSSYQKVSFQCFIYDGYRTDVTNEKDDTGTLSLRLCTDTAGNTPVHTIPIDNYKVKNYYYAFRCTKDFGANLNSSIKSIAIYVDTAQASLTANRNRHYGFTNIVACKADSDAQSVTHEDLIGLNLSSFEGSGQWYPVWGLFNNNGKTCILCQVNAGECRGRVPPNSFTKYCHSVFWPGGYQAGAQQKTIYKRKQFWHQVRGVNNNSTQTLYFRPEYSPDRGFPLRISGGWDATNMSTKTAGDITCIDAETCEMGKARFEGGTRYHSSGSGQGMHADGEVKTTHIEDIIFTRHYGYWQLYGQGFSINNCGFAVAGTGFYLYFSTRIKKWGLNMFYGFCGSSPWSTSYHGVEWPEHSSDTDLFLCNADGTPHSTYNQDTRYIKWCAGGGEYGVITLGSGTQDSQRIFVRFKLLNTEGHLNKGFNLTCGSNTNIVIDELRCGWSDGKGYEAGWQFNVNENANVTIQKLYTTLAYRGMEAHGGKVTINEWYDEDFGAKSTNQGFHGLQYYHYQQGGYFYQGSVPITVIVNGGTIKRYVQLYGGAKFFTNGLTILDTPQMTQEVSISNGEWQTIYHDGTSGNNFGAHQLLFVYADTTVRHTNSGYSMKFWPKHRSATATIAVAQIVFNAGSQVTVKLWMYKTDNNVRGVFTVGGFTPLSGVSTVSTELDDNDSNNTWHEKTLTFTPTGAGAATVFINCYEDTSSGNYYMYIDDLTVSQA